MKTRISARLHKETQRKKNALGVLLCQPNSRTADPPTMSDRTLHRRGRLLGTRRGSARSSDYQALLPIRGKILNVQKASVADAASRQRRVRLIGPGSSVPARSHLRSGRCVTARHIMTDADVDSFTSGPCCSFFHRSCARSSRWDGCMPPCHRCTDRDRQPGAEEERFHLHLPETEMRKDARHRLAPSGAERSRTRSSAGFLGDDADQLAETTMDPRHRTPVWVTIGDAIEAAQASSSCSWATRRRRARTSSSSLRASWTANASTPEAPRSGVVPNPPRAAFLCHSDESSGGFLSPRDDGGRDESGRRDRRDPG